MRVIGDSAGQEGGKRTIAMRAVNKLWTANNLEPPSSQFLSEVVRKSSEQLNDTKQCSVTIRAENVMQKGSIYVQHQIYHAIAIEKVLLFVVMKSDEPIQRDTL